MIAFGLTLLFGFLSISMLMLVVIRRSYTEYMEAQSAFSSADLPRMADIASNIDPASLWLPTVLFTVIVPGLTLVATGNLVLATGVAIGLVLLPRLMLGAMNRQRQKEFEKQLPDAFNTLASNLQAGMSLPQALEALVAESPQPLSYEFSTVVRKLRLGADFETASDALLSRMPSEGLHVAITAMRISRSVGGNLVEMMSQMAATIRRKSEMEGKIESLTAQGRVQGLVMGFLPLPLMGVLYLLEPEAMRPLFTTPTGWVLLTIIVVMLFLGRLSIRKIVEIDV